MRALVVIAASGNDDDLVDLAIQSLRPWGFRALALVLPGPHPHGFKLDMAKGMTGDADVIVTMDSDCCVFPGWLEWIERTLADPLISACGAPRIDGAPGLHPSMLAMRADLYRKAPSFLPTVDGRDTGVAVSEWLAEQGYLQAAPVSRGNNGETDWWYYGTPNDLWWHLGSGTASAWPGIPRYVYRHLRGLVNADYLERAGMWARRRTFIRNGRKRIGA